MSSHHFIFLCMKTAMHSLWKFSEFHAVKVMVRKQPVYEMVRVLPDLKKILLSVTSNTDALLYLKWVSGCDRLSLSFCPRQTSNTGMIFIKLQLEEKKMHIKCHPSSLKSTIMIKWIISKKYSPNKQSCYNFPS